jgi:hypothetical protein
MDSCGRSSDVGRPEGASGASRLIGTPSCGPSFQGSEQARNFGYSALRREVLRLKQASPDPRRGLESSLLNGQKHIEGPQIRCVAVVNEASNVRNKHQLPGSVTEVSREPKPVTSPWVFHQVTPRPTRSATPQHG